MADIKLDLSKIPGLDQTSGQAAPATPKLDLSKIPGLESGAPAGQQPLTKAERGDVSATAEPGFFHSLANLKYLAPEDWRKLAAIPVRGISSVLAAEGSAPGAAIAGGGEALAEGIEGGGFDPSRIAGASAAGAIPFGKAFVAGRPLASMLRGGLAGGAQAAITGATQGQFDPKAIAEQAGVGALTAGVGSRFMKAPEAAAAEPKLPPPVPRQEGGTRIWPVPKSSAQQGGVRAVQQSQYAGDVRNTLGKLLSQAEKPVTAANTAGLKDLDTQIASASEQAANARRSSAIAQAIQEAGLQQKGVSIGESLGATTPEGGKITMRTTYGPPEEEAETLAGQGGPTPRKPAAQEQPRSGQPADGGYQAGSTPPPFEPEPWAARMADDQIAKETRAEFQPIAGGRFKQPPVQGPSEGVGATNEALPGASEARARVASPSGSEQPPTGEPAEPSALGKFLKPTSENVLPEPAPGTPPEGWNEAGSDIAEAQYGSPEVERLRQMLETKLGPVEQATARAPKPASTTPVAPPGPETAAPSTTGTTTDWVAKQSAIADAAGKLPPEDRASFIQKLLEEKGEFDPTALGRFLSQPAVKARLASMAMGATGGGVIGAEESDNPLKGGIKGATLGGALGMWVSPTEATRAGAPLFSKAAGQEALKNLVDVRRASFLTSLNPALKKALIDPAGIVSEGVTQMVPGDYGNPTTGRALVKAGLGQYFNPESWKDFGRAIGMGLHGEGPNTGQAFSGVYERATDSPLGWVHLPLEGIQGMTEATAARAGATPEAIGRITGSGLPETEIGRKALQFIQQHPTLQLLQPFSKIPIHIAESVRNVPGVSQLVGGPGAKQRAVVGGANMALGALEQLYNQRKAEGGDPVSPVTQILQSGVGGIPYTVPNILGKAITAYATDAAPDAIKELINLIPGGHLAPDQPYPGETTKEWVNRQLKRQVTAMAPSALAPDTGAIR